jgi:predicted Zn-dependent protease
MLCYQVGDYERGLLVLNELIKRRPDAAPFYALLGAAEARQGRSAEAAAACRRATELAPDNHWNWYLSATLELSAGNVDGYRRACGEMLERFGKTTDPVVATLTAKACLLAPEAVADPLAVQKLAERSVTGTEKHELYRWFMLTRLLAAYRNGQHAEAVEWVKRFNPTPEGGPAHATAFAVLAMAQHHLGQTNDARAALAKGRAILAEKMPDPARGRSFDDGWRDWLHAQILCWEAENLLEGAKPRVIPEQAPAPRQK